MTAFFCESEFLVRIGDPASVDGFLESFWVEVEIFDCESFV